MISYSEPFAGGCTCTQPSRKGSFPAKSVNESASPRRPRPRRRCSSICVMKRWMMSRSRAAWGAKARGSSTYASSYRVKKGWSTRRAVSGRASSRTVAPRPLFGRGRARRVGSSSSSAVELVAERLLRRVHHAVRVHELLDHREHGGAVAIVELLEQLEAAQLEPRVDELGGALPLRHALGEVGPDVVIHAGDGVVEVRPPPRDDGGLRGGVGGEGLRRALGDERVDRVADEAPLGVVDVAVDVRERDEDEEDRAHLALGGGRIGVEHNHRPERTRSRAGLDPPRARPRRNERNRMRRRSSRVLREVLESGPRHMTPGTVVGGKYRLLRLIGEGAMGQVWAAVNELTGGEVALKLLPRPREDSRRRLLREARACGKLRHRNIIDVHDIGETDEGEPFLVMSLLSGETLAELLERKRRLEPAPRRADRARRRARPRGRAPGRLRPPRPQAGQHLPAPGGGRGGRRRQGPRLRRGQGPRAQRRPRHGRRASRSARPRT